MSQELLAIIEQIEREKGIKKEILIQAVESALLSAARKVVEVKPDDELRVELDPETGKIRAFKNNEEIKSIDFGRIAASTARQVIIQKIREAEKDVVFNEFQGRVGEIVSGTVYRFERGNIIVDLLGKAEGTLLKREQSPKEEFRQGQRIRAYVLEVDKDTKGPQIILSRTHPNLVKKLFELEVPEIYEGIVEIKSISRQAGERTKIAVCSKNEKVDSVGACVGMRGNRVRNIVNEFQGEKIDIVRYSEDIKEYIKAALSPAKVAEIKLDKQNLKAEVIVEDDQLSLGIGKHGQNVRLASRLVGWGLDIRTKAQLAEQAKKAAEAEQASAAEAEKEAAPKKKARKKKAKQAAAEEAVALESIPGIGEKTLELLKEAGFKSAQDLAAARKEDLTKVKGIGEKRAQKIISQAKKSRK
ncbi:MAG: transcription termination/antitermination protein NusA [Candidatus Omnitrophica bacterium]|nr:transcription termination/antitermination protein NusA [Candidatus Omnitrophota bacterium]MBL7210277.1 transcription termination/antitermination protein NusA [Candidatus Omnitrophota bacterium]